jgi:hypothetical protein
MTDQMQVTEHIAEGVKVEQRLDGLSFQVRGASPEVLADLLFLVRGALVPLNLMTWLWVWLAIDSLQVMLPASMAVLLVLATWHWTNTAVLQQVVGRRLAQRFTIQGQSMTIHGLFRERHVPLADIVAFDAAQCVLVTRSYRIIELAPLHGAEVRRQLAAHISEALSAARGGSPADIPKGLGMLRDRER